jgi:hypothetical protein
MKYLPMNFSCARYELNTCYTSHFVYRQIRSIAGQKFINSVQVLCRCKSNKFSSCYTLKQWYTSYSCEASLTTFMITIVPWMNMNMHFRFLACRDCISTWPSVPAGFNTNSNLIMSIKHLIKARNSISGNIQSTVQINHN